MEIDLLSFDDEGRIDAPLRPEKVFVDQRNANPRPHIVPCSCLHGNEIGALLQSAAARVREYVKLVDHPSPGILRQTRPRGRSGDCMILLSLGFLPAISL